MYVDGDLLVEGFRPKTVTDPVELPAGTHDVELFEAGADPATDSPAIADPVDVNAGANVSVVAHLAVDASPTLSVFANDTSTLEPGQARVTVRHAAAEQTVDIIADDARLFEGLTNGGEGVTEVPAGEIDVAVVPAGGTEVLRPLEATIDFGEGVNTIVYVVGQLGDGQDSLDFIVQTIAGLHGAPSGVESGQGGLKAAEQQHAARAPWMIAMAASVLFGTGVAVRRVRSG